MLVDLAVDALAQTWGCDVRRERWPRVVPLEDNYDRLRYPRADVTRDARYTRYVDDGHVLRSHASAMIPPALATVAAEPADDVLLVCPGITYRRDAIDRLHTGTPHQLDLWRITRRSIVDADLEEMLRLLVDPLAPGRAWRWQPRVHPYTLNGRQVDVRNGEEWVEVWECGLAHPDVLANSGLGGWSGLALGMGLDRLLMLRKGIPDIRLLRSPDPRVAGQMTDMEHYRPVSDLPAVTRDLSVAISVDDDAEQLGDRIRTALGDRVDILEAVTIVSETSYTDLPRSANGSASTRPKRTSLCVWTSGLSTGLSPTPQRTACAMTSTRRSTKDPPDSGRGDDAPRAFSVELPSDPPPAIRATLADPRRS